MKFYGKKPARPNAIKFRLSAYADLAQVNPPAVFGHVTNSIAWGMLGNDRCGDCVWAGGAHEHMLDALATRRMIPHFTDASVVRVYSDVTGYRPGDDSTDQGTDMEQAAAYRRSTGIKDADGNVHKIKAYVAVRSLENVVKAAYLFGACGLGLRMPATAESQFDRNQPWTVVRNAQLVGGHYVPCVGRNSRGNIMVITWGRLQAVTPEFVQEYMDEAVVCFSEEYLTAGLKSPELFDGAALDRDLAALGG